MKLRSLITVFAMVVGLTTMVIATDVHAGVHHPDCPGLVSDIAPGAPTPIGGTVWVKAGDEHYNVGYHDAGYVAGPQGGHAVSHVDVCPPVGTTTTSPNTTTTTTEPGTSTTSTSPTSSTSTVSSTTTTSLVTTSSTTSTPATSTTLPTPGLFAFSAVGTECADGVPMILITFPPRPELNGQAGELVIRDSFGDVVLTTDLTFIAGATVELFYPDTTDDVSLTYTLGDEVANAEAAYPSEGECTITTTTTTTTPTSSSSTTTPSSASTTTSSVAPSTTSSTTPPLLTTSSVPGGLPRTL